MINQSLPSPTDLPPPPPSLDPREPPPPAALHHLPKRPSSLSSRTRTPNRSPSGSRATSPVPLDGVGIPGGLDALLEGVPIGTGMGMDETDDPLGLFERDATPRSSGRSMSPCPLPFNSRVGVNTNANTRPNGVVGTHLPSQSGIVNSKSSSSSPGPSTAIFERDIESPGPITLIGSGILPGGSGYKTPNKHNAASGGGSGRSSFNLGYGRPGSTSPTATTSLGGGVSRIPSSSSPPTPSLQHPHPVHYQHHHHFAHDSLDNRIPTVLDDAIEALQADGYVEVESPLPRFADRTMNSGQDQGVRMTRHGSAPPMTNNNVQASHGMAGIGSGYGMIGMGMIGRNRVSSEASAASLTGSGLALSRSPSPVGRQGGGLLGPFTERMIISEYNPEGVSPGTEIPQQEAGLSLPQDTNSPPPARSVSTPPLSPADRGNSKLLGFKRPALLNRISSGPVLPGGFPTKSEHVFASSSSSGGGVIDLNNDVESSNVQSVLESKTWKKRMEDWIGPRPSALLAMAGAGGMKSGSKEKESGAQVSNEKEEEGEEEDDGVLLDASSGTGSGAEMEGLKSAGAMISPSASSPTSSPPTLSPHSSASNRHQLHLPSTSPTTTTFAGVAIPSSNNITGSSGKRKISFVSYNDMLQALPVQVNPLNDIVIGNMEPDHLPGTVSPNGSVMMGSRIGGRSSESSIDGGSGNIGNRQGGRTRSPLSSFGSTRIRRDPSLPSGPNEFNVGDILPSSAVSQGNSNQNVGMAKRTSAPSLGTGYQHPQHASTFSEMGTR